MADRPARAVAAPPAEGRGRLRSADGLPCLHRPVIAIGATDTPVATVGSRRIRLLASMTVGDAELLPSQPLTDVVPDWPVGASAVVVPGIPGGPTVLPDGRLPFPTEAIDIVKMLQEGGLAVEFTVPRAERADVSLNAAELWAPIIIFSLDALANGAGDLLASAIRERIGFGGADKAHLHLKVGKVTSRASKVEWLEADGPAREALEALEAFLQPSDDLDD
jgi:hypothetical protein